MKAGMRYAEFLAEKSRTVPASGFDVPAAEINEMLFGFQRDMTRWALRKGRAAIFADCGLGKSFMQIEWARHIPGRVLVLAPLTVAQQTVGEARKLGYDDVVYARRGSDTTAEIVVANYEMMDHFDAGEFAGVVLDESSILKSIDGKTKERLIEAFASTPYRLCCTATPAPNDIAEFANHAEFLGICSREEMLAQYFVHDDKGWRLKGHARAPFYKWLASWGMSLSKPSDLGYPDEGYELPPLNIRSTIVHTEYVPDGQMFATALKGITDRSRVRRGTLAARVQAAADLIAAEPGEQWIAWCGLNDESAALAAAVPGSIEVEGSMAPEEKAERIQRFIDGDVRVLVTKPRIAGFGLNMQNATRQVFVGLSDSYEAYYQCIRRSWRFGQSSPVDAHIVLSDLEQPIYTNVLNKEKEASQAQAALIANASQYERAEIGNMSTKAEYVTKTIAEPDYTLMLGDCVERIREVEDNSIDFSVFSPPFASLYTYSDSERDMGNSADFDEFFTHYGFLVDELLRVVKPGRNIAVHCQQLSTTLASHGVIGLRDFRGELIREHVERGWVYHGEICIDKDPQAQAIRTHAKSLLFVQLRKDSSWMRPAMADYILVFRKPGDNPEPVHPDISNDDWIEWARPIWYGIRESDTLNVRVARSDKDERHIAPLQLETIERCIRLWSNKGDTILSPFMGIGSEGHVALQQERKFVGIELKQEYFEVAVKNLRSARMQGAFEFEEAYLS